MRTRTINRVGGLRRMPGPTGGGSPQVWTPAVLGSAVRLWLTADPAYCFQDASATTPCGDGDPIRNWLDRSTSALVVVQATSGSRPILTLSGGLWYARFDGTDDYIAIGSNNLFRNTGAATVGMRLLLAVAASQLYFGTTTAVPNTKLGLSTSATPQWGLVGRRLDGDSVQSKLGGTPTTGLVSTVTEMDYANAACRHYANAVSQISTTFQTAGSTSDTASTATTIGADANTPLSSNLEGDIRHVVITHSLLSAADLSGLNAYLLT